MKNIRKILPLNIIFIFISIIIQAQNIDSLKEKSDSIIALGKQNEKITTTIDSINNFSRDTIPANDTIRIDTTHKKNNAISEPIDFEAQDSMHISVKNKQIILYGKGDLKTTSMDLSADSIGINMDTKEIDATALRDSAGKKEGFPIFHNEDKDYSAKKMRYNFKTKNGLVYNVMTSESDGFLHGQIVKIHSNGEMHILNGKYTTCDLPHPHYYIDLTKAKLKAKDKIITGPIYFVIQDIPLPIWAPFALFPLSKKNSSGIHFPTYTDELDRGFGLLGAGYFFAINDYIDLDLTGDVYSKGSWGIKLKSNINKRYLFTSSVNLSFFHYKNGEKILPTTKINNSYKIQISFNQAQKALPNSHISANINYVYGNIQQQNATNIQQFVKSTSNSSIAYQKTFQGTPFRMTATANMSQNLSDSTVNLKFPSMTFSMNKIFLFKPKNKPAKGKWYEKIGISFSSSLTNSVNTNDTILFRHLEITKKLMKSGFKYDIPLQTTFTLLKYINISPSFNFHGRIYPNKIIKEIGGLPDTSYLVQDTIWGFNHVYNYDTRVSMNTRIYGLFKINIGKLKAIRHTLSPSIGFVYRPDFSDSKWNYYEQDPFDSTKIYSYYSSGVYGVPGRGKQESVNFSLGNNFEAKIIQGKDTTKTEKKIKLLDNLSFSTAYNFAADSMNLSNISMNASMRPIKNTSLSFNANFDPYVINAKGIRINKFELLENQKIARLTNASLTIGTKISSKELGKNNKSSTTQSTNKEDNNNSNNQEEKPIDDGFSWNASVNYSFRFSKNYNVSKQEFDINLNQNASINLTLIPTPLWKLSIRSGYDFDAGEVTSTTFNFYRDLHCWEMSLQVTPFGRMKSYMFKINIKASMFDAIKFKKERSWHDNF